MPTVRQYDPALWTSRSPPPSRPLPSLPVQLQSDLEFPDFILSSPLEEAAPNHSKSALRDDPSSTSWYLSAIPRSSSTHEISPTSFTTYPAQVRHTIHLTNEMNTTSAPLSRTLLDAFEMTESRRQSFESEIFDYESFIMGLVEDRNLASAPSLAYSLSSAETMSEFGNFAAPLEQNIDTASPHLSESYCEGIPHRHTSVPPLKAHHHHVAELSISYDNGMFADMRIEPPFFAPSAEQNFFTPRPPPAVPEKDRIKNGISFMEWEEEIPRMARVKKSLADLKLPGRARSNSVPLHSVHVSRAATDRMSAHLPDGPVVATHQMPFAMMEGNSAQNLLLFESSRGRSPLSSRTRLTSYGNTVASTRKKRRSRNGHRSPAHSAALRSSEGSSCDHRTSLPLSRSGDRQSKIRRLKRWLLRALMCSCIPDADS